MIIWSRWGFLVVLIAGLGMAIGAALQALFSFVTDGAPLFMGLGLILGAAGIWAFATYLLPMIDKPQPVLVMTPPAVDSAGRPIPARPVQAIDPLTGQPLFRRPRSTLFFIPFGIWTWVVGGIGACLLLLGAVSSLLG